MRMQSEIVIIFFFKKIKLHSAPNILMDTVIGEITKNIC